MARKRKSGVTARQDSEARDVKDDRDSDEPIALREDAEECDEGARAADLDEHALMREELAQILRALEKRESDFAALLVAQQQQTEAMLDGFFNRFALALSAEEPYVRSLVRSALLRAISPSARAHSNSRGTRLARTNARDDDDANAKGATSDKIKGSI